MRLHSNRQRLAVKTWLYKGGGEREGGPMQERQKIGDIGVWDLVERTLGHQQIRMYR